MKYLAITILFFLWNSTYRCADDEGLISCKRVSKSIIGTWQGSQNSTGNYFDDNFTLEVTKASKCTFEGITSYSKSTTTYRVKGEIDMYGWVEFREVEYINDGGEYTNCTQIETECQKVRWQTGTLFEKAKFSDSELAGSWKLEGINTTSGNSWNGMVLKLSGKFNIQKLD
tara:strand:+ start:217 stop:729 length:513 start_codon:yes stop_codon:yes gene_type:complete